MRHVSEVTPGRHVIVYVSPDAPVAATLDAITAACGPDWVIDPPVILGDTLEAWHVRSPC